MSADEAGGARGEAEIRERELALKERAMALQERELAGKRQDAVPARSWSSPLVVAVFAAAVAAGGNAGVALINGQSQVRLEQEKSDGQLELERLKAESSRILQVIGTGDPIQAAENLKFLVQSKLVNDPEIQQGITEYLAALKPGEGPATPAPQASETIRGTGPLYDIIGGPEIRRDAEGAASIDINDEWYAANVVDVEIPQLRGVPLLGGEGVSDGKLRFHRLAAPALIAVFAEIEAAGLLGDIRSFGGALVARLVRGSLNRLSAHALGLAIDLNPEWNNFGSAPAAEGEEGSLARIAPIFEKHGFRWDGRSPRRDPMHFEFADRTALLGS